MNINTIKKQFPSPQGDSFFIRNNTRTIKNSFGWNQVSVPSRGFFFYSKKGVIMLDFGKAYKFPSPQGDSFFIRCNPAERGTKWKN